jgi:hypothetical protein
MRVVMENAGLSFWPALSLLIFFVSTLGVLLWIFRPGSSEFYRKLGRKPLEDGSGKATKDPSAKAPSDDSPSTSQPSPEE